MAQIRLNIKCEFLTLNCTYQLLHIFKKPSFIYRINESGDDNIEVTEENNMVKDWLEAERLASLLHPQLQQQLELPPGNPKIRKTDTEKKQFQLKHRAQKKSNNRYDQTTASVATWQLNIEIFHVNCCSS